MLFHQFGLRGPNQRTLVDELIETAPAIRPVIAQRLTLEAFESEYQIFSHHRPHAYRPLAVDALHPKMNTMEGSRLYSYIRRFFSLGIANKFGLSLNEFFDLPYFEAMLVLEITRSDQKKEGQAKEEAAKQLEMSFNEGNSG